MLRFDKKIQLTLLQIHFARGVHWDNRKQAWICSENRRADSSSLPAKKSAINCHFRSAILSRRMDCRQIIRRAGFTAKRNRTTIFVSAAIHGTDANYTPAQKIIRRVIEETAFRR